MSTPADQNHFPTENDFDPAHGNLDAKRAWRNFGGLAVAAAHARFRENPEYYQEDFMFMGPRAFQFYFPVIDRFLREHQSTDEGDDGQAWILGQGIMFQLKERQDDSLFPAVTALASFVRSNLSRYGTGAECRQRVDQGWQQVQVALESPIS